MAAPLENPFVLAHIEAAIAPFRGLVSEEELALMRAELAHVLASDDRAARLLAAASPRHVDESGVVAKAGAADAPTRARKGA